MKKGRECMMGYNLAQNQKTAPSRDRLAWMDALRGFSIVLVILNHAVVFTYDNLADAPELLLFFNEAFSPLRMPLMVFLSGLLVPMSLDRGSRRYSIGKLRNVLYPYFVWSLLMIALLAISSIVIDRQFEAGLFLRIFYSPIEHLWFVAYLFIFYAVALLTPRVSPLIIAAAATILSFAFTSDDSTRFWVLLSFFMLGVSASRSVFFLEVMLKTKIWALPGLASFITLIALTRHFGELRYVPSVMPLVACCIVACCILARLLVQLISLRSILFIGRESIIYYLFHWPAILVSLLAIRRTHDGLSEHLELLLAFAISITASTLLSFATQHSVVLGWLFKFAPRHDNRVRTST